MPEMRRETAQVKRCDESHGLASPIKVRSRWRRIPYVIQQYRWWRSRPSVSRHDALKIAWRMLIWMPSVAPHHEHELIPAARMSSEPRK